MGKIRRWLILFKNFKSDIYVLFLAYRDPRMPRQVQLLAMLTVVYAFSPLDLVPDLIPLLGYLDDLVLIPLGMRLAMGMVPPAVLQEYRFKAQERKNRVIRLITWLMVLFLLMVVIITIYSLKTSLAP